MAYPSHGRAEFRRDDDVLVVDLYGPWNLECMRDAQQRAVPLMQEMDRAGPWGIIVLVHGPMLGTPDAIQEVRQDVAQASKVGRVGVAWVVDATSEGRNLMIPVIEGIYQGKFPVQFFTTQPAAQRWIKKMIQERQPCP